ncbi:YwpF-like family protein [Aquibacillus sp. 3ASR75-11]|uniref:YwpF-like family protein n=1 Tax=Terrihalobacillus insolitus TaxID=2950438 RepID=A0A9X3WQ01_9BACI|nr:YwpF-like family protein [Terrihalobacillus insolitus]MDC3412741.1 YwpF-like family protein [Terrihalobacillus insolitus]MDC3423782.1 YwpF-like family protein [Terrihalobacillus insolitus]
MKTFKLISLDVLEDKQKDIVQHKIPLLDGLIINREDDKNHWVLEAYLDKSYLVYFNEFHNHNEPIMLQAKITKESNEPATFMSTVIDVNEIGDHINVLFIGTLVDRKKSLIEHMLKTLIEEGHQGEKLLEEFKERI